MQLELARLEKELAYVQHKKLTDPLHQYLIEGPYLDHTAGKVNKRNL